MVKFPQIDPILAKKAAIVSEIHDFKGTARIAGLGYALGKLGRNAAYSVEKILHRSKSAGEKAGRSTAEWVCTITGEPATAVIDLEGVKFGYSSEGELLYPLTRQWD